MFCRLQGTKKLPIPSFVTACHSIEPSQEEVDSIAPHSPFTSSLHRLIMTRDSSKFALFRVLPELVLLT